MKKFLKFLPFSIIMTCSLLAISCTQQCNYCGKSASCKTQTIFGTKVSICKDCERELEKEGEELQKSAQSLNDEISNFNNSTESGGLKYKKGTATEPGVISFF